MSGRCVTAGDYDHRDVASTATSESAAFWPIHGNAPANKNDSTATGALNGNEEINVNDECEQFVFALNAWMKDAMVSLANRGTHKLPKGTFTRGCHLLLKTKKFPDVEYGKSRLVHVYRKLVREGKIEHEQEVENQFVKKLSRSTFGGINVSVFVPPGHTAPIWVVTATRHGEFIELLVDKQKSVYTLLSYEGYCRKSAAATGGVPNADSAQGQLVAAECSSVRDLVPGRERRGRRFVGGHRIAELRDGSMIVVAARARRRCGNPLFHISLDGIRGLSDLSDGEMASGTVKGADGLRTCTFGCVYCPTEVDGNGEQVNPKSYLTHEPGVLRAVNNNYNTVEQVYDRVSSLAGMGHDVSKVFVRCVGGTWSVLTANGQRTFMRDILRVSKGDHIVASKYRIVFPL